MGIERRTPPWAGEPRPNTLSIFARYRSKILSDGWSSPKAPALRHATLAQCKQKYGNRMAVDPAYGGPRILLVGKQGTTQTFFIRYIV